MAVGTIAYMSPEQAMGEELDRRTDLFSLGLVLYEMATGRQAFSGSTSAAVFDGILNRTPVPPLQLNPQLPPRLEQIFDKALEKDLKLRYQTASDFRVDLQRLRRESESYPSAKVAAQATAELASPAAIGSFRHWPVIALASAIVAIALIVGAYVLGKREGLASSITPPTYHQLTFRGGTIRMARFAPDGKNIVYSAAWEGGGIDLFVTRPDSPESRPFGLSKAEVLSISSEGEMAVLLNSHNVDPYTNEGTLGRVPLGGGAPREVLENVQWADWSPDGTNFAVVREFGGLSRLEYPIGKVLFQTGGWLSHPRVSPKGDVVAFIEHPVRRDDAGLIAVVDLSGKKKTLSNGLGDRVGTGLVSGRNRNLVLQHPARLRTLSFRGKPLGKGAASGARARHIDSPGCSERRARADYPRCAPRWNGRHDRWQHQGAGPLLAGLVGTQGLVPGRQEAFVHRIRRSGRGELFQLICAAPMGRLPFASVTD